MIKILVAITAVILTGGLLAGAQEPAVQADNGPVDFQKMYTEGERLAEIGQLEQAHKIFFTLLKEFPDSEDVNFAYGMVCFSEKKYSTAKLSMERVIAINPKHAAARFTLGRIHLTIGQDGLAREQFKEVLRLKPSQVMKQKTKEYLGRIQTETKSSPWHLRVDAGLVVDDNVNVGPEAETINIAPVIIGSTTFTNLTVSEESQPDATYGVFISVSASGTYDIFSPNGWMLNGAASYYQNWLEDNAANESLFGQAAVGLSQESRVGYLDLPVVVSHITYGGDPLLNIGGIQPALSMPLGSSGKWYSSTLCKVQAREYDELDDRDGTYLSAHERITKYSANRKHNVSIGVGLFQDLTDSPVYEHTGLEWQISGRTQTLSGTVLYSTLKYTATHYAEKDTLAFEKREDTQTQLAIGFARNITRYWGIDANYQHTDNRSTFGLYQYDRNMASFSTFYSF